MLHQKILMYVDVRENSDQCMFVLPFNGPVNNEVMSSRSVNSGTVPGQA